MEFHSIKNIYIYIHGTLSWTQDGEKTLHPSLGPFNPTNQLMAGWLCASHPQLPRLPKTLFKMTGHKSPTWEGHGLNRLRSETKRSFQGPNLLGEVVGDGSREDVNWHFDKTHGMMIYVWYVYIYLSIYVWFGGEFGWNSGETRTVSQRWGDCRWVRVSEPVCARYVVCKYSKLDAISTNNQYYMIPVSTNAKKLLLMDIRS